MKHNTMLTVASLLSLLFLTLHITDGRHCSRDIEGRELKHIALLASSRSSCTGHSVLPERRSGHVIMLLIGLFAAAMPVIHMRGRTLRRDRQIPRRLFLRLDTLGTRRARGASPRSSRRAGLGICGRGGPSSPGRDERWRFLPTGCCNSNYQRRSGWRSGRRSVDLSCGVAFWQRRAAPPRWTSLRARSVRQR